MDAYQLAHEQLKKHYGTSGRAALAKAVLSLYNGPVYGFGMAEILAPLDSKYLNLVMGMMNYYAKVGETQTLRDAGEYAKQEFPALVELAQTGYRAKQELREKWDRGDAERIEREEAERERREAERRSRRTPMFCATCNEETTHEPRALNDLWFCIDCYTESRK